MRLAIISDIHSNLPALETTLAAIDKADLDEVWCLGDVVGYGAQPDECSTLVAERCSQCLVGNHDLAVLGELDIAAFSPAAAAAVQWTRRTGSPDTIKFLRGLKPAEEALEVGLYHGSPRDPVWEYVLTTEQAEQCLGLQAARVSLIGHSHVALYFSDADPKHGPAEGTASVLGAQAPAGTALELGERRWLINPGSVGQPRDGDPRAAWLELDTERWTATYHRLEYEIDRAASAIVAAGLPDQLAQRLYVGL